MNITKVQIHIVKNPNSKVKAFADIIIDDEFIVKGLAIRESQEGYTFVTMPFRISGTDEKVRQDIAHPIKEDCRKYIEDEVLDEYEYVLEKIAKAKTLGG